MSSGRQSGRLFNYVARHQSALVLSFLSRRLTVRNTNPSVELNIIRGAAFRYWKIGFQEEFHFSSYLSILALLIFKVVHYNSLILQGDRGFELQILKNQQIYKYEVLLTKIILLYTRFTTYTGTTSFL